MCKSLMLAGKNCLIDQIFQVSDLWSCLMGYVRQLLSVSLKCKLLKNYFKDLSMHYLWILGGTEKSDGKYFFPPEKKSYSKIKVFSWKTSMKSRSFEFVKKWCFILWLLYNGSFHKTYSEIKDLWRHIFSLVFNHLTLNCVHFPLYFLCLRDKYYVHK